MLKSPEISETVVCPTCGATVAVGISICPNDKTVLGTSLEQESALPAQYEVIEEIGSGGMGVIYKARHTTLDILVAIKMLNVTRLDEAGVKRFAQEANALSLLSHPNIVGIRDYGVTATGQPYMVLDYIDANPLSQHLAWHGPCSEMQSLSIFLAIAAALAHAHERGVCHRDIKPSNIMLLRSDDGRLTVKIVDFGIAKVIDQSLSGQPQVTKTGEMLGSPAYMSPEQALGKPLDQRSDIYSLGCVMYETLTGVPPFSGPTPIAILTSQLNDSPSPMCDVIGDKAVSANLEQIVQKSLSKNPEDRFQSMEELESALSVAKAGFDQPAHTPTADEIALRSKKLKEKIFWLSFAIVLALVGIVGLTWATKRKSEIKLEASPLSRIEWSENEVRKTIQDNANSKELKLALLKVNDEVLSEFDNVQATETLNLQNAELKGPGLAHLIHLPLKNLDLKFSDANDRACEEIHHMKGLEALGLGTTKIDDTCVKQLSNLTRLRRLDLSGNHLSSQAIFNLHRLPGLRVLYFGTNTLSAEGAAELGRFPELTDLFLDDAVIGANALENLKLCQHLGNLELDGAHNVTAAQVASLANLPNLHYLTLRNCKSLNGLDCSIFRKFPQLENIALSGLKISNRSLAEFINSRIDTVHVDGTDISDDALNVLAKCKTLKCIVVQRCPNLTERALAAFKQKRPDCKVIK